MELEGFVLSFFDFVGNLNFNMFGSLLAILLVIFWLVIVGWVWVDSGERTTSNRRKVVYMLLVILLNIPGLIIYLIVRPSETIEEIYWADLERRYLKYETSELGDCPNCGFQLYPGFVHCSNCGLRIKVKCKQCSILIDKGHKFCEFCGYQMRDRAINQEKYPNVKVMEEQIKATKEEVTETVKSKRVRYKTGQSFVVKLGNILMLPILRLKEKRDQMAELKKKEEKVEKSIDKVVEERANVVNKSKEQKKKKKKRRKK